MLMAASLFPFLFLLLASAAFGSGGGEADALLLLKSSLTNASSISTWSQSGGGGGPCSWNGVACDSGAVASLRLASFGLSGSINVDALARLPALRSISLDDNSFSGPIPPFSRLQALKSIYLTGNSFSGTIPDDFFSNATHLKKLWLSNNSFEGSIPSSLSKAISLMELHLDGNRFTGAIPDLLMPTLVSFVVSKNQLSGPIPLSLRKFNASAFAENVGLCGPPLGNICAGAAAATSLSAAGASSESVGAALGLVLVIVVIAGGAMVVAAKHRKEAKFETLGVEQATAVEEGERKRVDKEQECEALPRDEGSASTGGVVGSGVSTRKGKRMGSSIKGGAGGGGGGGRGGGAELVMVNESIGIFGLPDLMKAAAEVVGNGGMGSAYKAVMANGVAVAVKRMREMNRVGKETFEVEMRRLGRLSHPNVLPPLAYYYRKEEKLLITEFIPKGSLLYILHGDRGTDHEALNWPTRLNIIRGIAAGMAYIHAELNSIDIPHGNLKSGNVLLGAEFDPLLVDYGFLPLVNPSHAAQTMFAYKSPEILSERCVSPKSDVYCLGIIVLELLSGKFPSQYMNNTKGGTDIVRWTNTVVAENLPSSILDPSITQEFKTEVPEMERLVRIGAELIEENLERRPDMKEATKRIEEVATAADARRKESGVAPPAPISQAELVRGDSAGPRRAVSITERSRSCGDNVSFAIS